jgi:hypothetical protein
MSNNPVKTKYDMGQIAEQQSVENGALESSFQFSASAEKKLVRKIDLRYVSQKKDTSHRVRLLTLNQGSTNYAVCLYDGVSGQTDIELYIFDGNSGGPSSGRLPV